MPNVVLSALTSRPSIPATMHKTLSTIIASLYYFAAPGRVGRRILYVL